MSCGNVPTNTTAGSMPSPAKGAFPSDEHGVRKEDYVRPHLQRMERQNHFGVYFILKSREVGPTFRSSAPKYPAADPDYRIIGR